MKDAEGLSPDIVEIAQESVIVRPVPELAPAGVAIEAFEIVIGRMGQDEADAIIRDRKLAGIAAHTDLCRHVERRRPWVVAIEVVVRQQTG
jgi:hypothetical protein